MQIGDEASQSLKYLSKNARNSWTAWYTYLDQILHTDTF